MYDVYIKNSKGKGTKSGTHSVYSSKHVRIQQAKKEKVKK